jgi:hypothetical protein
LSRSNKKHANNSPESFRGLSDGPNLHCCGPDGRYDTFLGDIVALTAAEERTRKANQRNTKDHNKEREPLVEIKFAVKEYNTKESDEKDQCTTGHLIDTGRDE